MNRFVSAGLALVLSLSFAVTAVPGIAAPMRLAAAPAAETTSNVIEVGRRGWHRKHYRPYYGHHYRHYRRNHVGPVIGGLVAGAIIGGIIASQPRRYYNQQPRHYYRSQGSAHVNWCLSRYRSYDVYSDTFQPYHGPRRACRSPYAY